MGQSHFPFPDLPLMPAAQFDEPAIWVRRIVFVERPIAPISVIRRVSLRRGLNIVCTEPRLPSDTKPIGHSVGKSLLVRTIRYCLGEDRFCTESQRSAITLKHERGYVLAAIRVAREDWVVARPLGIETGYGDSWCARSRSLSDLIPVDGRLKYREFVDALEAATSACYADIDLPQAGRRANWRDLLGWLSRDQGCHFDHHADWRDSALQAGPRALTREDAYLLMRMSLGLLGPDEIGLIEKHRKLLQARATAETHARQYEAYIQQAELRLRASVTELKDSPSGEVFGAAFGNLAEAKVASLTGLLSDPEVLKQDGLAVLQDELARKLRAEGALQAKLDDLGTREEAAQEELKAAQQHDSSTLLRVLNGSLWQCSYYKLKKDAMSAGCPGKTMVEQGIADPWRKQRIADITEELETMRKTRIGIEASLDQAAEGTRAARAALSNATADHVRVRDGLTRQIGQWSARRDEAERYAAAWRDFNAIESGRDARQKQVDESAKVIQGARARFEKQRNKLSAYYEAILKQVISPEARGSIKVDGDGMQPESNDVVADSGTTLRQYADVLGLDLACLAASLGGIGNLPRFWIHDSPRQADSEEELYHSIVRVIQGLERSYSKGREPFQYILTTTSAPPQEVNHWPYVRLRLHARTDKGKLLKCDFGK